MLEALWSIEFISKNGNFGAGIVVLESGRVYGGDSSYYYIGEYSLENKKISIKATANHYSGPVNNIVGPVKKVTWTLNGVINNPNSFDVHGFAETGDELVIRLTHRASLP
jgi:hypothetical protein